MLILRTILRIPWFIWTLIFGGYMYFLYQSWENETMLPLRGEIIESETRLKNMEKENKAAETFSKERDTKFQELQTLAEDLNKSLEKLPRTSDVPTILNALAEISDRVGIEFTRFEPGKAELKGFLMETPFKVELRGSFVQIMSFLDEVAHLKRIISGESVTFKDPLMKGQDTFLRAEATLVTYHFDENARISQVQEEQKKDVPVNAASEAAVDPTKDVPATAPTEEKKGP